MTTGVFVFSKSTLNSIEGLNYGKFFSSSFSMLLYKANKRSHLQVRLFIKTYHCRCGCSIKRIGPNVNLTSSVVFF